MHQFKAPIAGNSKAIAKIGNAELAHFNKQMLIHELIRGSLGYPLPETGFEITMTDYSGSPAFVMPSSNRFN